MFDSSHLQSLSYRRFYQTIEFIWITGIILALATVSFGVTGYSLAWDQIGYWACKIVTSVPEALDELIPQIGSTLVLFVRGGFSVNLALHDSIAFIHLFYHL